MSDSESRKTNAGKDDRDRGDLTKRRASLFYKRSRCCNAHVRVTVNEGVLICTDCGQTCYVYDGD